MRSRFGCLLLESGAGRLTAVGELLAEAGAAVERMPLGASFGSPPPEATVVVADARDPAAADLLRQVVTPAWLRTRALVALARGGDTATTSRAVAMGADDVLGLPVGEPELLERLDFAATLARTRAEVVARDELLAAFRGEPAPAVPRHLKGDDVRAGARVLMVGPPGALQTQLVTALGGAALAYAEDGSLPAALAAAEPFDLLVRTGAAPWPRLDGDAAPQPPVALVLPREAPEPAPASAAVQPLSVLRAPMPADLARLRLGTALRLARLRQHLRRPPADGSEALALDALTGLANQGFLLAYAARLDATAARRRRVVVGLAPADFERWSRTSGHPAANRALAAVGREVRRMSRAEDFGAHVGEGRVVMVVEADADGAEALRRRLAAAARRAAAGVLGGEPGFETAAEPLRPGEATGRALERALLRLRASRAFVA